jgi:hypothetical protein
MQQFCDSRPVELELSTMVNDEIKRENKHRIDDLPWRGIQFSCQTRQAADQQVNIPFDGSSDTNYGNWDKE